MDIEAQGRKICLALIKISVSTRRKEFRNRLEGLAFDLIAILATDKHNEIIEKAKTVDNLIVFGEMLYEIETINAQTIREEVRSFVEIIEKTNLFNTAKELPDIKDIFAANNIEKTEEFKESGKNNKEYGNELGKKTKLPIEDKENEIKDQIESELKNAAIRQQKIIESITNSSKDKIQLKDIVNDFPNVSERTLRYDLQKLCSQGIIERIGQGGPGTKYTLRII